jgi:type II secretory pathway component PulF
MLVASGLSMADSLEVIKEGVSSGRMKKLLITAQEELNGGYPLWKVLRNMNLFQKQKLSLIRIGEESGRLAENLKIIVAQEKKDQAFKSKIRSATIYPMFIFVVALLIGIGVSFYLLPKLITLFSQMKIELPLFTRILIKIGTLIRDYGSTLLPSLVLGIIALFYFVFVFNKTKVIGQFLSFNFFVTKRLIREIELARFSYMLGILLQSGLSITESLESLSKTAEYYNYRNLYIKIRKELEEGNSFQKIFSADKSIKNMIPRPIQQMIVVGENSGNLPETLLNIGDIYEEKLEETTRNLSVLLEPILLVIIWLGVLFLALAIIMPIYGIIGGINKL